MILNEFFFELQSCRSRWRLQVSYKVCLHQSLKKVTIFFKIVQSIPPFEVAVGTALVHYRITPPLQQFHLSVGANTHLKRQSADIGIVLQNFEFVKNNIK
jgi:hypothetical protein